MLTMRHPSREGSFCELLFTFYSALPASLNPLRELRIASGMKSFRILPCRTRLAANGAKSEVRLLPPGLGEVGKEHG
jgi:hypothetical protein